MRAVRGGGVGGGGGGGGGGGASEAGAMIQNYFPQNKQVAYLLGTAGFKSVTRV